MKCINCGQELENHSKFCSNCGWKVGKVKENEKNEEISDKDLDSTEIISDVDKYLESEDINKDRIDEDLESTQLIPNIDEYLDEEDMDELEDDIYEGINDEEVEYLREDYYEEEGFFSRLFKNKTAFLIIGLAVIIALGYFIFRDKGPDLAKDDLIEEFIEAIDHKDVSKLARLLNPPETDEAKDMKIDKDGIESLLMYIEKNPGYVNTIEKSLKEQSEYYNENTEDIGYVDSNFILRYDGDEYSIEVKPYYMNISVQTINTNIIINDESVAISDSDDYNKEFGPFMPGLYTVRGELKDDFDQLEVEEIIELIDESPADEKIIKEIPLNFDLASIEIITESENANIIINGKEIGKTVSQLENRMLKNISKKARLQIVEDTPWGEFKSEEVIVGEIGNSVELNIELSSQALKDDIMDSVNKFLKEDILAKKELDAGRYTNLLDPELKRRQQKITELGLGDIIKEISIDTVSYDLDSIVIIIEEGKYYGNADLKYDFIEKTIESTEESETIEDMKYLNILLVYEEGIWKVFDTEENSSFEGINVKEFKF